MREITAEDAMKIKIPNNVREQFAMDVGGMEKEIFEIESFVNWPLWPVLPMKNVMWRQVDSRLPWSATIIAMVDNEGNMEKRVYLINTFGLRERGLKTIQDVRDKVEFLEYKTWKEMIDNGWRVD